MSTNRFSQSKGQEIRIAASSVRQKARMNSCQEDYPLDWYQPEFTPYAEEYQSLPDRTAETVLAWMKPYMSAAQKYFGEQLLLLAHYYMGGEIVNLVDYFGGQVGDSYQLALKAALNPDKKIIVESAVHFMAESISILAHPDQQIFITNPKSGCTMEMHAKDYMVEPAFDALNERYGADNIIPICYMNTSGRVKALTGEQNGAVCTSSNVKQVFEWALAQNKRILFIPDQFMGENVANWTGISHDKIAYWPSGEASVDFSLQHQSTDTLKQFDQAQLFLFSSHCSVHSYMRAEMVEYWKQRGYSVIAHPECRPEVVNIADAVGSTALIQDFVSNDKGGHKKYAIGTENHMVKNLRQQLGKQGFDIVNLGDAPLSGFSGFGCGCATMSRNAPPHLVATLDLLRQGKSLDTNTVQAGDVVNEFTGVRHRLSVQDQEWLKHNAKKAMQNMIDIVESKK